MISGRATQFTAAGAIAADREIFCVLIFTPTTSASTCTIKSGGASGTTVLDLAAPADGPSIQVGPIQISSPYLSAITAGAKLTVVK